MTKEELVVRLQRGMRSQANDLDYEDYIDSIEDAEQDLGWSFPQTEGFRLKWLRLRSIRHLLYFLQTGAARKFRFEGAHLHQRFAHYSKLVEQMDKEFAVAVEENSHLFAGVDAHKMFGYKIDAGFSSNELGQDTTYYNDNEVIIEPTNS